MTRKPPRGRGGRVGARPPVRVRYARLRLALVRGDMVRAEEKLARLREEGDWYRHGHGTSISTLTAEIDALAALGYRELVEREAPALLHRGTYGEPFAWRALGLVREDWELIRRALRASRSSASTGTFAETRRLF
jgi:hypothetical protein